MKLFVATLLLVGCSLVAMAQQGISKVYNSKNVVYFGIDYTHLKLVHNKGFINRNGNELCASLTFKYFKEWNEMFVIERNKFDLEELLYVNEYVIELDSSDRRNNNYQTEGCIIGNEEYVVTEQQKEALVQHYSSEQHQNGVGILIVGELLSKEMDIGKYSVLYFDLKSNEILLSEKVEGKPGGQGIRNYWINSLYESLLDNKINHRKRIKKLKK